MTQSHGPLPPAAGAVPLDPALVGDVTARRARPPYRALGVTEVRRLFREAQTSGAPGPAVGSVEDSEIEGPETRLRVRVYRPGKEPSRPLIVYLHGGGFAIGDLDTHDRNARGVAAATGAIVMSVEYRLAPEHRFPAAIDDALHVIRNAPGHAEKFGADPTRIFVAGDSAGATLAIVAAIALRGKSPRISGVIAVYPMIDHEKDSANVSYASFGDGTFGLSEDDAQWFREQYVPNKKDQADWRASPGRTADLAGLPPSFIVAAAYDVLRDEDIAFAHRLKQAGVQTILRIVSGTNHGFMGAPTPPPAVTETLAAIGEWFRQVTTGNPPG